MKYSSLKLAIVTALFGLNAVSIAQAAPILQAHQDYSYANHAKANAWLEIDVKAFENNITRLQQNLSDSTKICAIMKADAYGNGIDLFYF